MVNYANSYFIDDMVKVVITKGGIICSICTSKRSITSWQFLNERKIYKVLPLQKNIRSITAGTKEVTQLPALLLRGRESSWIYQ
jgi:hypothetical protein